MSLNIPSFISGKVKFLYRIVVEINHLQNFDAATRKISIFRSLRHFFEKYIRDDFDNFLEIGCGTGFVVKMLAKKFPHKKIYASEYLLSGLYQAKIRLKNYNNGIPRRSL